MDPLKWEKNFKVKKKFSKNFFLVRFQCKIFQVKKAECYRFKNLGWVLVQDFFFWFWSGNIPPFSKFLTFRLFQKKIFLVRFQCKKKNFFLVTFQCKKKFFSKRRNVTASKILVGFQCKIFSFGPEAVTFRLFQNFFLVRFQCKKKIFFWLSFSANKKFFWKRRNVTASKILVEFQCKIFSFSPEAVTFRLFDFKKSCTET